MRWRGCNRGASKKSRTRRPHRCRSLQVRRQTVARRGAKASVRQGVFPSRMNCRTQGGCAMAVRSGSSFIVG
jgi:hypothetical protein